MNYWWSLKGISFCHKLGKIREYGNLHSTLYVCVHLNITPICAWTSHSRCNPHLLLEYPPVVWKRVDFRLDFWSMICQDLLLLFRTLLCQLWQTMSSCAKVHCHAGTCLSILVSVKGNWTAIAYTSIIVSCGLLTLWATDRVRSTYQYPHTSDHIVELNTKKSFNSSGANHDITV